MTILTEEQAREFAAILDGYEDMIATANAGKTDTLDDIRTVLRNAGLKGSALADELANFRSGAADARLLRTNPEKAERKEKKRDGATDYLFLLTRKASRTHEGHFSEPDLTVSEGTTTAEELEDALDLPRGSIGDRVTPHNPDTGEVIETPKSCGVPDERDSLPVDAAQSAPVGERKDGLAATQAATPHVGIAPGPQDTITEPAKPRELSEAAQASRAKAAALGYVLSDEPFEPVGVSIPDFKGNTDQVGRA